MDGRTWVIAGCISGALAVIFGAFGAHALAERLTEKALATYHTGAQYQVYHALALLGLGVWATQNPRSNTSITGLCWVIGTLLFSGSLYALALSGIKVLGAITPFGGVLFIVGWISFAFQAWKA